MQKFGSYFLACLIASALTAGCGGDLEISEAPLSGNVLGEPWTFQRGHTSAFLSEGEDDFFALLYAQPFTECGFEPSGPRLIVSIPKETGEYDFGLGLNMTFSDGVDNLITSDGRIVVDSVSATRVTGGLAGSYDADNEVTGRFDIAICPD